MLKVQGHECHAPPPQRPASSAAAAAPRRLVLKARLHDEIRRIPLPAAEGAAAAPDLGRIRAAVAEEFGVEDASTLGLLYKSKEGELCPLLEHTVPAALGLCAATGGVLPLAVQLAAADRQRRPEASAAPPAAPPAARAPGSQPQVQEERRKCARCSFCVGKISLTHCCNACRDGKAQHGPHCERLPFDGEKQATAAAAGENKCASCDFAVTGVCPQHCCNACRKGLGQHGPACKRRPYRGGRSGEAAVAGPASAAGGRTTDGARLLGKKCAHCPFSVTGICQEHCCGACSKRPGQHGPACRRIVHSCSASGESQGDAAKDQLPKGGKKPRGKKCANCLFTVTGIRPDHCCNACSEYPGHHGPACKRILYSDGDVGEDGEDSDAEALHVGCCQGGWADSATDDEYGLKAIQRISAAPADTAPKRSAGRHDVLGPMSPFQVWVVAAACQVGNLAHEVRTALRFWSSLVTTSEDGEEPKPEEAEGGAAAAALRRADALSGRLGGLMRRLAGRVRNVPLPLRPLGRLLPRAQELMDQIWANLSALDSTLLASTQQREAVEKLVTQQGTYLKNLQRSLDSEQFRASPPPLPDSALTFSQWSPEEVAAMATASDAVARGECLSAEQLLSLACLACNSSHELQNLAVPPRGAAGAAALRGLRRVEAVAGRCGDASRGVMVLAHRWKVTSRLQPVRAISERVSFLIQAEDQVRRLLGEAMEVEGGSLVPAQAYHETLGRLHTISSTLLEAKLAVGLK